jgi:hypothetical protein
LAVRELRLLGGVEVRRREQAGFGEQEAPFEPRPRRVRRAAASEHTRTALDLVELVGRLLVALLVLALLLVASPLDLLRAFSREPGRCGFRLDAPVMAVILGASDTLFAFSAFHGLTRGARLVLHLALVLLFETSLLVLAPLDRAVPLVVIVPGAILTGFHRSPQPACRKT